MVPSDDNRTGMSISFLQICVASLIAAQRQKDQQPGAQAVSRAPAGRAREAQRSLDAGEHLARVNWRWGSDGELIVSGWRVALLLDFGAIEDRDWP